MISSVIGFDFGRTIKSAIKGEDIDSKDLYQWQEKEYKGEEIFQEEFVIDHLNLALGEFLQRIK